jgi:sulfite exporter TauE/SafE
VTAALLATGLLGSLHCVGMCGGFALALDRRGGVPWRRVGVQATFHLGKTGTYVVLGGLAGVAGGRLAASPVLHSAQAVLAVVAGSLMVLAGLQIAGVVRSWAPGSWFGPGSAYDGAVRAVSNARGPTAAFAMGALTGLLPCPLVYGFLAYALGSGGVLPAMGVMAVLGLASVPALAVVVLGAASVPLEARRRAVRLAGVAVAAIGVATALRGLWPHALHAVLPGA